MKKYSKELKLKVVKYYLKHKQGYVSTAKHFGNVSDTMVLHWVRKYKERGEEGLERNKKQSYSGKFKEDVVKYMHANHLSYLETAIHFNLGSNNIARMWEQIYYEKGPQGLYERKQFTKSNMKFMKTSFLRFAIIFAIDDIFIVYPNGSTKNNVG